MWRKGVFAATAALTVSLATAAAAQGEKTPMSAEAMWGLKRVGAPALSPDGRHAVVAVTSFDLKTDRRDVDLWLFPTDGSAPRQLTADPAAESEPQWSPDGQWIAFVARRDADQAPQLYVLPTAGGEARRVTEVPTGVRIPRWLPDSRRVAFLTRIWTDLDSWADQGKRLKERADSKMTARVWDKPPIYFWDQWIDDRQAHVFTASLDGGAPVPVTRATGLRLSANDPNVVPYDIAPDGTEIAFVANMDETGTRPNNDVFVARIDGTGVRNLTESNPAPDFQPKYSPDGRWLAFLQRKRPLMWWENAKLMLHDRRGGTTRQLAEGWDRSIDNIVWSPDSAALYGSIDDEATLRVYRFDLNKGGAPTRLTQRSDTASLDIAGKPPVMVAIRQSFSEPPTLVRVDLRTGATTQLSRFNDAAMAKTAIARTESVTYKGANGRDIQMWVTYPPGFDPSRKYPLFLAIHGGPHVGWTDRFSFGWNSQVFAGWGYVVAWHNFHGSSGFGEAFADSIAPDWTTLPYEDTLKAAEWFAAQPWIDSERMVAGGGSYGGYLTTVLLGREHPFKALVAHAAPYNLYSQVAADIWAFDSRDFEYWEEPEKFQAISPHMRAEHFKTPTLVIHGQTDYRVPVNQSFELFHTLQKRKVPSRLIYYPNEHHWIQNPQNSVFFFNQVREWIERYAAPTRAADAGGSTSGAAGAR